MLTERFGRVLLAIAVASATAACRDATLPDTPLAQSTFDSGDEGWGVAGDAGGQMSGVVFQATGGNPGGYVAATDNAEGGTWYFRAPEALRRGLRRAHGGTLRFDLRQSATDNPFADDDVVLEGGGLRLVFDLPNDPGTTWTSYAVPLNASGGWINEATGQAPTERQLRSALSSATDLLIRGEYRHGPDTGSLDNVIVGR